MVTISTIVIVIVIVDLFFNNRGAAVAFRKFRRLNYICLSLDVHSRSIVSWVNQLRSDAVPDVVILVVVLLILSDRLQRGLNLFAISFRGHSRIVVIICWLSLPILPPVVVLCRNSKWPNLCILFVINIAIFLICLRSGTCIIYVLVVIILGRQVFIFTPRNSLSSFLVFRQIIFAGVSIYSFWLSSRLVYTASAVPVLLSEGLSLLAHFEFACSPALKNLFWVIIILDLRLGLNIFIIIFLCVLLLGWFWLLLQILLAFQ